VYPKPGYENVAYSCPVQKNILSVLNLHDDTMFLRQGKFDVILKLLITEN